MPAIYKVTVAFNQNNLGRAMNSFTWRDNVDTFLLDSAVLAASENYINDIFGPLRPYMDTGYVFIEGQVAEIAAADGSVVRLVGGITPTISGTAAGDMLPSVVAASGLARTEVPKVRGTKRFGGIVEAKQDNGLFDNPLLAALAGAVAEWIAGDALGLLSSPGVWSEKQAGFVPFNGSGLVTNIPGSQVSRKPGRGV